jgi:alkanesulfonate monooxygenase SsuD/methylene tetrahydromethanopterin reductase-like flavin-dependent oxidoreductase (luciferase family)
MTLASAAAVTQRIGLMTDILLAATREPVLLAKQAATLDQISGGRFVLGIGAGARSDDFAVTSHDFRDRGKRLDAALDLMHRAWRGESIPGTAQPVTPSPVNGQLSADHVRRPIRERRPARR